MSSMWIYRLRSLGYLIHDLILMAHNWSAKRSHSSHHRPVNFHFIPDKKKEIWLLETLQLSYQSNCTWFKVSYYSYGVKLRNLTTLISWGTSNMIKGLCPFRLPQIGEVQVCIELCRLRGCSQWSVSYAHNASVLKVVEAIVNVLITLGIEVEQTTLLLQE